MNADYHGIEGQSRPLLMKAAHGPYPASFGHSHGLTMLLETVEMLDFALNHLNAHGCKLCRTCLAQDTVALS